MFPTKLIHTISWMTFYQQHSNIDRFHFIYLFIAQPH